MDYVALKISFARGRVNLQTLNVVCKLTHVEYSIMLFFHVWNFETSIIKFFVTVNITNVMGWIKRLLFIYHA